MDSVGRCSVSGKLNESGASNGTEGGVLTIDRWKEYQQPGVRKRTTAVVVPRLRTAYSSLRLLSVPLIHSVVIGGVARVCVARLRLRN